MMYKEKLRRKLLLSLQIVRLRLDQPNSLTHGYKDRPFSKMHSRRTRGNSQIATWEILIRYIKNPHTTHTLRVKIAKRWNRLSGKTSPLWEKYSKLYKAIEHLPKL